MCLELMRGMMRGVRICYFIGGYEFFFLFLEGEKMFFLIIGRDIDQFFFSTTVCCIVSVRC